MCLDFLIDKTESVPTDGEYIYNHNTVWLASHYRAINVDKGRIVINLIKQQNNSFTFNFKDDESKTLYHTNYGWSFIESSPLNIEIYNEYLLKIHQIELLNVETERLFDSLPHLGK